MKYCAGIGMHDAELLGDEIEIRIADGTETIRPMFQTKEKKIKTGDLIYTSKGSTIAWLGKKDVDSDDFKVTEYTKDIILVILGNAYTDNEYSHDIAGEIYELIKMCCRKAVMEVYEIH
jgi:DNA/RNA-binding domain of Phe-tRNA-synthetase-like protein